MKRWALIADVHGNAAALDAVVADLESIAVDGCVLMGDYVLFGPRPRECCDRLREMAAQGAVAILGNTDRYVHEDPPKHPASELIGWTRKQIGDESVAWLGSRPFDHRIEAPGGPADPDDAAAGEVLVVHATPEDVEGIWDDRTPEDGARRLLGDARADWILYGHIHVAREGRVGDQRVRSIGSVGFPFDGDPRAAWALLEHDGNDWRVEHRRVAYDHESVAREIERQATQWAGARAQRIREARAVPFPARR